jgi:pimeloyl-ACP methyl ester carboxylesterase
MGEAQALEREVVPTPPNFYTEPEFVTVGGVPTAYRRKGNGEPVLFLHGAGSTRMWLPFYETCAQSVDFIAPEHPGFGETPMVDWITTFDDLLLHYDAFLDALELEQIHMVGYSLGGWIAAEYASFLGRRLKSFTLITPIGLRLLDDPGPDIFKLSPPELIDRLYNDKNALKAIIPDAVIENGVVTNLDPEQKITLEEIIFLFGESSAAARYIWSPRYNLKLERRLQRLDCPSLVVCAEEDRLVPNAMAERFADALPGGARVTIPETGHALIVERAEETAKVLEQAQVPFLSLDALSLPSADRGVPIDLGNALQRELRSAARTSALQRIYRSARCGRALRLRFGDRQRAPRQCLRHDAGAQPYRGDVGAAHARHSDRDRRQCNPAARQSAPGRRRDRDARRDLGRAHHFRIRARNRAGVF